MNAQETHLIVKGGSMSLEKIVGVPAVNLLDSDNDGNEPRDEHDPDVKPEAPLSTG